MSKKESRLRIRYFLNPFIAVLIILSLITFFYQKNYETNQQLIHSQEVKISIRKLRAELKDAEIGQRGYVITQDSAFLAPYFSAQKKIKIVTKQVRNVIGNDSLQLKRLDSIEALGVSKFRIMQESIDLVNKGKFWQAIDLVKSSKGKMYMDQARSIMNKMYIEENIALKNKIHHLGYWRNAIIILILFSLIFIGLSLYRSYIKIKPIFDELVTTQDTLHNVNDNLSESLYKFKKSNKENEHLVLELVKRKKKLDKFVGIVSKDLRGSIKSIGKELIKLQRDYTDRNIEIPANIAIMHEVIEDMYSSIRSLTIEANELDDKNDKQ